MQRRLIHLDLSVAGLLVLSGIVLTLWLVILLRPIVLLLVVSAMFAAAVEPAVDWLESHGVPRAAAVVSILLVLVLALGLFGLLLVPLIIEQAHALIDRLPELRHQVVQFLDEHSLHEPAQRLQNFSPSQVFGSVPILPILNAGYVVVSGVAATVTVVVVAAYIVLDAHRILRFVDFATPARYHVHVHCILAGLQSVVGGYIRGQVITSILAMIVAFSVFTVLGIPNALALAVFAGIADVVPIVGIYLFVIPSALAALTVSVTKAIIVAVVLFSYQELESRVIVQRVYGQTLRLPSVVVVVALLIGAELQGVVGALLALPAAAAIRVLVEYGNEVRQKRARTEQT
jgi:predicted PurR-regulated permease PerM